jgi:hypothetical protein
MAQGYRAQDDVDRLAHDPVLRMATWDRPGEEVLEERSASQPTHSRLIDIIAHGDGNQEAVRGALSDWVERHLRTQSDHAVRRGTIDIDSFPVEVFGDQAGAAYNGYYQKKMYHPLVASFSVAGDYDSTREGWRLGNGFMHAILRRGNAHTAEGCLRFLDRVLELAPQLAYVFDLRFDAGFMIGRVLDYLARRKVRFLGRLKSNPVLDRYKATQLGDSYWLYVVWDPLGDKPELVVIRNPAAKLDAVKKEIVAARYFDIPADAIEKVAMKS